MRGKPIVKTKIFFLGLFLLAGFSEGAVDLRWNPWAGYHAEARPYDHLPAILKSLKQKIPRSKSSPTSLRNRVRQALSLPSLQKFLAQTATAEIFLETVEDGFLSQSILVKDPLAGEFFCQLLLPFHVAGDRFPALVALHGHGGNAESFADSDLIQDLVRQGVVVMIPWFRAMRREYEGEISPKLMRLGFPLMGIRIYEAMRAMQVLEGLKIVDVRRLGAIGHSGGSTIARLLSYGSPAIKACVTDHESGFGGGQDNSCCEHLPHLRGFAYQIHKKSNHPCPLLKTPYNYLPKEDQVLGFLHQHLKPPGFSLGFNSLLVGVNEALSKVQGLSVETLVKTTPATAWVGAEVKKLIHESLSIPHPSLRDRYLTQGAELAIFMGAIKLANMALKAMIMPNQILDLRLKLMTLSEMPQSGLLQEFEKILDLCHAFDQKTDRDTALARAALRLAQESRMEFSEAIMKHMNKVQGSQSISEDLISTLKTMIHHGKIEAFLSSLNILKEPQDQISMILEGSRSVLKASTKKKLLEAAEKTLLVHKNKIEPTQAKLFRALGQLQAQDTLSTQDRTRLQKTLASLPSTAFTQTEELLKSLLHRDQFMLFSILLSKSDSIETRVRLLADLFQESGNNPTRTQFLLKALEAALADIWPRRDRLPFIRQILDESGDGGDFALFNLWFQKALDSLDNTNTKFDRHQDEFWGLLALAARFGKTDWVMESIRRFPANYPREILISKILDASLEPGHPIFGWRFTTTIDKTSLNSSSLTLLENFQSKYRKTWSEFIDARHNFLRQLCNPKKPFDLPKPHNTPMIQTNSQSPQASECLERLLQAPASVKNLEQLLVLYQSPGILLPPDKKRLTEKLTARILSLEEEADEIDLLLVKAVQSFQIGGKTKKARQVQRQIKDKSQSLLARMEISNSLPLQEKLQEISQTLDLATNLESPVEKAELLLKMLDISPRHILLEKTLKILREIQKLSHNLELEDRQRVAQNLMEYCLDQPWLHQAIEQAPFLRKFLEPREKDVSISLSLDLGLIFHQLGNPSKSRKWLRKTLKGIWKAFPSSEGLLTFRDLIEEHQHQQLRIPKGLLKELAKQLASRMHSNDSQNEKFCEELEEIKSSESTNTLEPLLEVCR